MYIQNIVVCGCTWLRCTVAAGGTGCLDRLGIYGLRAWHRSRADEAGLAAARVAAGSEGARASREPGAGVVGCLCVALLPRYGPHAGTLAAFAFLRLLSPTVILASLALPATPSPF